MSKFVFQLETVLNVREKKEQTKKTEYGHALNELINRQKQLKDLDIKIQNMVTNKKNAIKSNIDVLQLQSYDHFKKYLYKAKELKKKQVTEQEKHVEIKRMEMLKAVTDKKAINKLKEKQFNKFLECENKLEQKVVDEIVSYRFINK